MSIRRVLPAVLLLAAFASMAVGAPRGEEEVKQYRKDVTKVLIRQKTYEAKEMDRQLREAYATYIKPWLDRGKPDAPKVIEYDFSGYRAVFEKWAGFETERAVLVAELAKTGGEAVAKQFVTELYETCAELFKQDRVLSQSRPKNYTLHDQVPAILRWGASIRLDALVEAIGALRDDEAIAFLLSGGFERADKFDVASKSVRMRTALLDALARTGRKEAEAPLLAAAGGPNRRLRIVGVEGLARLPLEAQALRDKLAEALLTDPCFAVRVAALACLGTAADPKSVPLLAKALDKEILGQNGVLRAYLRRALLDIVGTDLGEAPESWTAWYDRNRPAIEDGTWKKGEDAGKTGAPDEKDSVAFYDIRTLSRRILLLVDASDTLIKPVDIELAKTKNFFEWNATAPKDRNYVSQYQLLMKETLKMVEALRGNAVFDILVMHGSSQLSPFWPQGMAPASDQAKKMVKPFLEKVVVGGWAPQIEGIWQAWRLAGGDPWGGDLPDEPAADTIFLLSDGSPSGGEIIYGPALVDEVRRKNRFFRIPIHTVRIDDYKDTAKEFMEGVAEATGGTAVWRTKP